MATTDEIEDHAPAPADYSTEKRLARTAGVTLAWWAHGGVRLALALVLMYYGAAKLVFGQFGFTDMGDALIAQGEMSPMGVLWRMVALSPLFQFLAGLAEFGAALALLWRRTAPLGAALAGGSMALVFVLNLGYDVPVKQISLALLIMSVLVLIPWMPRLARAFLGHGAIRPGPVPVPVPWRPLAKVTDILAPVAGLVLLGLVGWHVSGMYPERSIDETAPAGVWAVQEDTAEPAAQLSEDTRWSALAFGEIEDDGRAAVQLRHANGELLTGSYERTGEGTVELSLRPLREPGTSLREHADGDPLELTLDVEERGDGTLHVTGEGQDLVLAPDESAMVLHERGFSWGIRPDDPFNR